MPTIGMIGLGHMGLPMLKNLVKGGFTVHAYDLQAEALKAASDLGAIPASDLKALTSACNFLITSVQTGDQVKELCLSQDGIFLNCAPGSLFIDCSSIDIKTTRALHTAAAKHKIEMLDAPVSGGVAAAEAATLTIMVGGEESAYQRALPVLSCLGKKIVHTGNAGTGQAAKICNNLLLGISMIGVSEAFALAEKLGLSPEKFYQVSSNASGQCWSMTSYCPYPGILENVPSSNGYRPGFTAKMMLKDLRLGQSAAKEVDAAIPLGGAAAELYEMFVDFGQGESDFSGIIKLLAGKKLTKTG